MENKNNKKIILILAILVIAAVLYFVGRNISWAPVSESDQENDIEKIIIDPKIPGQTLPLSNDPKDLAWALFQKYLGYNKDQNLDGVRSVVYKVAAVCEDPKTTIDCKARMNLAYQYGSALIKEDFTNVWSDERQIILATDFWLESSSEMDQYGRFRSIIFFVKGEDGEWKLLSFSPTKGGATNKGSASQEEIDERLTLYSDDNDKDGIADYEEECLNNPGSSTCIKTSPKLRDTDGDGFWDGVDALLTL